MEDGTFEIELDGARDLMVLRLSGLWDADTGSRFIAALDGCARDRERLASKAGCLRVLIDVRAHAVQTQETAALLQRRFTTHADDRRRIAMLVDGRQLQQMQIRRVAAAAQHAFFLDETEALDWLGLPSARSEAA